MSEAHIATLSDIKGWVITGAYDLLLSNRTERAIEERDCADHICMKKMHKFSVYTAVENIPTINSFLNSNDVGVADITAIIHSMPPLDKVTDLEFLQKTTLQFGMFCRGLYPH